MLITRVFAENFGCHERFEGEFCAGICGILGKNGSGKSTVLDMIRFGITGQIAAEGSKVDNVMWGADTATVTVDFEHGDSSYSITRTLGKRNSQKLVTPGETLTRKTEITEFIESLCSTTVDALLNNVFVPQGKIDSILFSTNTQRLREIQETVGLQQASEAEKHLRNEASRYSVTPGLDQQIKMIQESIEENEDRLAKLNKQLTEVEAEISELQPYEDLLNRLHKQSQNNVAIRQADERIEEVATELTEAVEELDKLTERRDSLRKMAGDVKSAAEDARSLLAQHEADKRAVQATEELRSQLATVKASLDQLGERPEGDSIELEETISKLSDTLRTRELQLTGKSELPSLPEDKELHEKRDTLSEQLQTFKREAQQEARDLERQISETSEQLAIFESGQCPTCGQEVAERFQKESQEKLDQLEKQKASLNQRWKEEGQRLTAEIDRFTHLIDESRSNAIEAVQRSKEKVQNRLNEVRSQRDALTSHTSSLESLQNRKEMLEGQLQTSVPNPLNEEEVERLQKLVSSYERTSIAMAEQDTTVKGKVAIVEKLEKQLQSARNAREELGAVAEMPNEAEIKEAKKQVETLFARTQSRQQLDREITSFEVQQEQYVATKKRMADTLAVESVDAEWVKICKRAREVLHVSGLPSLLMREYAAVLNRRIAHYLSIWEANFSMHLDEELAFVASKEDSPPFAAARLSGGQKVIASTSFRSAMADTFARQVGLLVLDEPSNHLDKDNVVHLQNLILKLKEAAGATGRQVIMVDHEESLVGFFDHVITLDPIQRE